MSSTEPRDTMGDFLMTYPFLFSLAKSFKENLIPGLLASKLHYFSDKQKEEAEDKEGRQSTHYSKFPKMVFKTKVL